MSKYKRINLYYKTEDDQDSLRYALLSGLGYGKKRFFDYLIDEFLKNRNIFNIEELTLRDLQEMKREFIQSDKDKPLEKQQRPRGRPKKEELVNQEEENKEIKENTSESSEINKKSNPMSIMFNDEEIEEETEEENEDDFSWNF